MDFRHNIFALTSATLTALALFLAGCDDSTSATPAYSETPPVYSETIPVSSSEPPELSVSSKTLESSSSPEFPESSASLELPKSSTSPESPESSAEFSPSSSSEATSSAIPSSAQSSSSFNAAIPVPYGCIVNNEDNPPYENYEDPECVVKQLTQFVVDSIVKQGLDPAQALNTAKLKLYSIFSIDSLLQTRTLHSSSIGIMLSLLIPLDSYESNSRTEFIEAFSNGESFGYLYACQAYENFTVDKLKGLIKTNSPWASSYDNYEYTEANLILNNLWRYCGHLPICGKSNHDIYRTYECTDKRLLCKDNGLDYICSPNDWIFPTNMRRETHDKDCSVNNTRIPSDSTPGQFYICHEGIWYFSKTNNIGKLPKDYFFNDSIKYGTMEDPRDGKKYRTVVYENQVWMAENINYYDENDSLLKNHSLCSKKIGCNYGRFYDVDAATKACPNGWHLPKEEDIAKWIEMPYVESSEYMPKLFARLTGVRMASDEFGLSILSINNIDPYGWDENGATSGFFWLDSRNFIRITDVEAYVIPQVDPRENGQLLPVRCIKD